MVKKLRTALLLASSFLWQISFAQTTVAIGTATTTDYTHPAPHYYSSSHWEAIYLQSEIDACGNITAISFYKGSGSATTSTNMNIYMKHTTASTLATGTWDLTGYTTVYTGSLATTASNTWVTVTLTTPFAYNGSDNLSIALWKNAGTSSTLSYPYWRYTSTSATYRTRFNTSTSTTLTQSYERANLQLTLTPNPNPGTPSASPSTVCTGSTTNLTLSGYTGGSTFQWQSSPDNSVWTNIAGATADNYLATVSANTYYRCRVTNGCTNSSSSVYVDLYTTPPTLTNNAETNLTCSSFDANWTSAPTADHYMLDVNTNSTFTGTWIINNLNVGNVLTYAVTGLTPNTTYYFRARAVDICGQASGNAAGQLVTTLNTPTAPALSASSAITITSYNVNWGAVTGASAYFLDVNTNSSFTGTWIVNNLNVGNVLTYGVTGLTCNTIYYARVRAINVCSQTSANSSTTNYSTTTRQCNDECSGAIPLTIGTSCVVTNGSTGNATQTLSTINCGTIAADDDVWYSFVATCPNITITCAQDAVAVNYDPVVELRDGCTGTNLACAYNATTATINYTTLTTGNTYYIRTYDNAAGSGDFDLCIYNANPVAPVSSAETNVLCNSFDANWAATATATSYRLDVNTNGTFTGTWILNNFNVGNVLTYPVTGLSPSTLYYYRVRGVNDPCSQTSLSSGNQSTTTLGIPTAPALSASSAITITSYNVNWGAVTGASAYFLDVNTNSSFTGTWIVNNLNVGNVLTYGVTGLTCNTIYYARVRAINVCSQTSANSSTTNYSTTTRQCNDECSGAIPLTIGTSCVVTNGSTGNATQTLSTINCGTIAADDDVWYSFVATCPNITITCAQDAVAVNYDPVVELRDGCTGTNLACAYNATTATINYTTLTTGNTYYIRTYDNAAGSGDFDLCIYNANPVAPVSSAETNVLCNSFDANWAATATATSYRLDVNTNGTFTGTWILNNFNVGNVLTYPVTGLSPSTLYYYRVRGVNDPCSQTSLSSGNQSTTTLGIPTAPALSASSAITITSYNVNWGAVTGASAYFLDVNTNSSFTGTWIVNNLNVGNVLTYGVTGLTCNTIYYARVRAINVCSQTSANSSTTNYSTTTRQCNDECSGAIPLTIGTSCVVTNGSTGNATQTLSTINCGTIAADDDVWYSFVATCPNITITCAQDAVAVNYDPVVELRDGCTGTNLACAYNATTATINYTTLTTGNTYYIRTYDNLAGSGDFDICIYNAALAAPTNNAETNVLCTSFDANWSTIAGADHYMLDVSTVTTFASFVAGYNNLNVGNVTTYNVSGLSGTTTYYYRVRSVTVCGGASGNAAYQTVTTITPSGNPTGATASANPICVGQSTNLSVTGGTLGTGASWKWYSGNICSGAATLVGTGSPLTVYPTTTTTYYVRAEGTCGNTTCQPVTVTVNSCYVQPSNPTASASYTVCSGTYYDNGGASANYTNSQNNTITFYPSVAGNVMQMAFTSFGLQTTTPCLSYDYYQVYNGNSTSAPLLGTYCGTTNPGTFNSCAADGSLTFKFFSNSSTVGAGWAATISCVAPVAPTAGTASASTTNICSGSTVVMTLTGNTGLIQWQESPAGCASYTDIAGATSSSYTSGAIAATKCYRAKVYCGTSVSYTNNVTINVVPCYNHATTVASTYTVCAANYYDEGGSAANYANSRNIATTFYPSTVGQMVEVNFSAFALDNLSACPDYLEIYNGNSTAATLIGQYCQSNSPGTITSCAADGSLTFRFVSNSTTTQTGWAATVSCVAPSAPTSGTAAAAAPTVCTGTSTNISLTGYSGVIQWQESTGGCAVYNDIAGATSPTYSTAPISVVTCFRAKVSCGATDVYSNIEVVAVTPCVSQPLSGSASYTVCAGNYYDGGGPSANYGSSQTSTLTLYPSTAGQGIQVTWSSFNLENSTNCANDYYEIYNGNSTSATLIGRYCSTSNPGTISSCAADGSLTFKFSSNSITTAAGWAATISCVAIGSPTAGTASANPTTVCYGGTVLSLAGSSGTIQWQESPAGCGSFTNIAGAVNPTYTVATLASTKCYQAVVSCGGVNVTSNQVTVTYSSTFTTNTWLGGTTAWATATNWSLGVVPGTCHNVDIPNTASDPILSAATSVNNVTIQNGGVLRTDAALTVYGTFSINNGGLYRHNNTTNPKTTIFNGVENFGPTSTFEIMNWEGTSTANYAFPHNGSVVEADAKHNTPYGHFIMNWNKPSFQWEWHGQMTLSSDPRIAGDLTLLQTGTNDIHISEDGGQTHTLQNVTVTGGAIRFKGHEDGFVEGSSTLNINGNLTVNGGTFTIEEDGELSSAYVNIVNISGNLSVSGASSLLKFCDSEQRNNPSVHEYRVNGNMSFTGGTIYQTYSGTPVMQMIRFNGSGTQTYFESGSIAARYFNYNIPTGKTVQLTSNMLTCLTSSTTLYPTVHITGTLIAGNYKIYPSPVYSTFTQNGVKIFAGGRLQTTNVNGFYTIGSSLTTLNDVNVATTPQTVVIDPLGYVEYNGTTSQLITNEDVKTDVGVAVSPSRSYGILDINNTTAGGSALTMAGNVETDQLRLRDGIVSTAADTMTVLNTSAGAGGSVQNHTAISYLNTGSSGALKRYVAATGSYDYPVGNSTAYELMNLNITGGNTSTYISTNFSNPYKTVGLSILDGPGGIDNFDEVLNCGGVNSTTGNANDGVWIVNPNSGGTATYDMSLSGLNYDNNGALHTIVKRIDAANPWINPMPGTYVAASGTNPIVASRTSFSGFSHFAIAKSGVPLPVSLLSFKGSCVNGTVTLNWSTASEMNNDFFTVARSSDGMNFTPLGIVQGAGNSSVTRHYTYNDPDPMTDDTYYRLIQTDHNGNSETFAPLLLSCDDDLGFNFNVNTNLLGYGGIPLSIIGAAYENVLVVMTNSLGQEVYSKMVIQSSDSYLFSIDLQGKLAPGMYFITASSNDTYISRKIVVK